MKIINTIIVLFLLFVNMSCMTRLKVNVMVADRDKVLKEVDKGLENQLPRLIKIFNVQKERGKIIHKEAIEKLSHLDTKEIPLLQMHLSQIENEIKIFEELYAERKFTESYNQLLVAEKNFIEYYDKLQTFLLNMNAVIAKTDSAKEYIKSVNLDITDSSQELKKLRAKSNRLRFHLLGDPLTSFITWENNENDKQLWNSLYNETKVSTFFGNADIAILLRKNVDSLSKIRSGDYNNNFTIKGVRLDAEDAIQASFATLTQSINLFAAMQLPELNLTSSNANTDYPTIPQTIQSSLGTLESYESKINRKEKFLKEVKKLMLHKIIYADVESNKLGNDDDKKEFIESVNGIYNYWNSLKTKLETIKTE